MTESGYGLWPLVALNAHVRHPVIRFTGRRMGITGKPSPADRFEQEETVQLVPGSGPVAITTRAGNVGAGEWLVRARLADRHGHARGIDPDRLPGPSRWRRLGKRWLL